jgi:hypothetical protein
MKSRWRAWLAITLIYAVALNFVLGSIPFASADAGEPGISAAICRTIGDNGSPAPAGQHDRHCDECCLVRAFTFHAPPLPSAFAAFALPMAILGRPIPPARESAGRPVEAWSVVQAQRGPPERSPA